MDSQRLRKMVFSAIMIALSVVLSFIVIFNMPYGGSITLASMAPILLISFLYDTKWAVLSAVVYGVLQMAIGFYPPPVQDIWSFVAVILLDYIVAFGALGLAGFFARMVKNTTLGVIFGTIVAFVLRFICHFISGIIIWGVYAPEGVPVWLYSLGYNGLYMLGEGIITCVLFIVIIKFTPIGKKINAKTP